MSSELYLYTVHLHVIFVHMVHIYVLLIEYLPCEGVHSLAIDLGASTWYRSPVDSTHVLFIPKFCVSPCLDSRVAPQQGATGCHGMSFDYNTTLFNQVTAFYGNECVRALMKLSFRRILSLLEAEFAYPEWKYQHAGVDTDQEEDTKELDKDFSAE